MGYDKEKTVVLHGEVEDQDGNHFMADVSLGLRELQRKLDVLGFRIVRK